MLKVSKVSKMSLYQGPTLDEENNDMSDSLVCSSPAVSPESTVNSEANIVLSNIIKALNSGEEEIMLAGGNEQSTKGSPTRQPLWELP